MAASVTSPVAALGDQLGEFLRTRRVEKGGQASMTGMGAMRGRWMVTDDDYSEFLDELNEYLFVQKRRPQNFVEQRRPDGYAPLLIDLDFKYSPDGQLVRRFDESNIQVFIHKLVNVMTEFYDLSGFELLRFFVCLRPMPYEQRKSGAGQHIIKDGVHIECPDIVLPSEHQQVIRAAMLESGSVAAAFDGTEYINKDTDIYDESMVKKAGWFFYGESKPDIPPYLLKQVYQFNPESGDLEIGDAKAYTSRELLELLSIRYNIEPDAIEVREEATDHWEELRKVATRPPPTPVAETAMTPGAGAGAGAGDGATVNDTVTGHFPSFLKYDGYDELQIEVAKRLARECLSAERMDGFQSWIEVGWCLHAIDSSPDMFQVWMDASAKSPKFNSNDIGRLKLDWDTNWRRGDMPNKLTLRSLHYWAKLDNPQRYKEITEDDIINKIQFYYDAVHTHVGQIMFDIFWENYKSTADSRKVEWYEYKNHVWRKLQQGIEIRSHIATKVRDLVVAAQNRCRAQFGTVEGRELKDSNEYKRFEKLMKFETQLYNASFKNSVMQECQGIFYEEDFSEKLNMNPYLVGCANGVLCLRAPDESPRVTFRSGRSEDYISFQAGRNIPELDAIAYRPYRADDPIQLEIDDFMSKIFPDPELRNYMWKLLASCLEANNREQCYYIWTGGGGNGKSKLVELMRKTLGDYVSSLQSTALTRKRPEAGAANPEIMAIRNKRFIYMQEPDDNEPLNTSRMKQFSGEDMVEARGLFADQTKFKITGKLHMMCNKLPPINTMDRGTWRRIRVIPFVSKFVDPMDPDINPAKNVFPKDDKLDAKMNRWREAFFARLVHVYEHDYCVRGLEPAPAVVMSASQQYKESFDAFAKFRNSCIRQGGKAIGGESSMSEMWRAYGLWHSDVGVGTKMKVSDFEKRVIDEFGEPEGKKRMFRHIRVFNNDSDATAFDNEE